MALYTFRLPDIGEGIAEAEIVGWHVKVGDRIEEDQPIADMMTDKATVEMESPVAGTVVRLAGEPGQQIAIGSMLVEIETEGEGDAPVPRAEVAPAPAAMTSLAKPAGKGNGQSEPAPIVAEGKPAAPVPSATPSVAPRGTNG